LKFLKERALTVAIAVAIALFFGLEFLKEKALAVAIAPGP